MSGGERTGVANWHMYAVGAAKAALAARLAADWQARVAAGATLDDILLDALTQSGIGVDGL
jgi:hypothetical protein